MLIKSIFLLSCTFGIFASGNNLVADEATKYIGKKYIWGGTNPNVGADCSGFTQYLYKQNGVNLPRTALSQSRVGTNVPVGQFQKGDLLFFNTDKSRGIPVSHVGMYLGGSKFIHAKGKQYGVTISNINEYANSFRFAKRVIGTVSPIISSSNIATNETKVYPPNPYTAGTRTNIAFDAFVVYNGKYVRLSQLEKGVM